MLIFNGMDSYIMCLLNYPAYRLEDHLKLTRDGKSLRYIRVGYPCLMVLHSKSLEQLTW